MGLVDRVVRKVRRTVIGETDLRRSLAPEVVGELGSTLLGFRDVDDLPGWFNVDDCSAFSLALALQRQLGVRGDIVEIGSYHGRSTVILGRGLRSGESIIVCDAFEQDTDDPYTNRPTEEGLQRTLLDRVPGLDRSQIEIHACYSSELQLDGAYRLRFAHIDGGHSETEAAADLELVAPFMVPGGVIVVDDYGHPRFPGVRKAVDGFLNRSGEEFTVLVDLNRHGAKGRKIYLGKVLVDE